ncbi:NAD(P)/FAD-dependent oxidoreductase [Halomicronema sp. CCY15110]|uniref:NAD(P)/FAD-dependent oxidoreductase n=1 Tax=Halomicronema sp. CCY15110 TaxID=2767773 RepID=UPI001950C116|nr:FAD-dependent oxidoreductase [Halomicronema sp. CCY15110]
MTIQDVIVVGAGLAGLVCAQRLQQAGHQVCLLEKSRGLGGRLATRRIDGVPLDHGARYLANHGDRLQQLIDHWGRQGILAPWQPQTFELQADGSLQAQATPQPYWVAPAGMNTIGKHLAQGLTIHRQQRLISLTLTAQKTWQLTAELATDQSLVEHQARAVVLALPAPQILPILAPLEAIAAIQPLRQALATVTYAPVITVMAQYAHPRSQASDPLPCAPPDPWMVEGHPDTSLFWAGLDSSKRPPTEQSDLKVVMHSSAAFARDWFDLPDLPSTGRALLGQASTCIAAWLREPQAWQVHRWRYGLVETSCLEALLTTSQPLPLAACGDWCGSANLDTALESGWAAAAAIHTALGGKALPSFPAGLLDLDAASH